MHVRSLKNLRNDQRATGGENNRKTDIVCRYMMYLPLYSFQFRSTVQASRFFCHSKDFDGIACNKYIITNLKYVLESCHSIVFSCRF